MKSSDEQRRRFPPFPLAVIGACAAIVIGVSLYQDLSAGLLEAVLLILGLWGSYILGQASVPGGDVRPRVRGSYRRMATLHGQLFGLTQVIAKQRDNLARADSALRERGVASLEFIEFAVGQNLSVVADAMEDWADVVPEEVADLKSATPMEADDEGLRVHDFFAGGGELEEDDGVEDEPI